MRFPHLMWAIAREGFKQYELAARLDQSESHFSRCLSGRAEFSDRERALLAALLTYPESWLFREIVPPRREILVQQDSAPVAEELTA